MIGDSVGRLAVQLRASRTVARCWTVGGGTIVAGVRRGNERQNKEKKEHRAPVCSGHSSRNDSNRRAEHPLATTMTRRRNSGRKSAAATATAAVVVVVVMMMGVEAEGEDESTAAPCPTAQRDIGHRPDGELIRSALAAAAAAVVAAATGPVGQSPRIGRPRS